METEYIGTTAAAAILHISIPTMNLYCRAGKFKTAEKIRGTVWRVAKSEIEAIEKGDSDVDFSGAMGAVSGKNR